MSHASVADHRAAIARLLGTGTCQTVVLDRHAAGRRVAADLAAADDLPRFDNSAMDGYAVRPAHPDQREFVVVADVPAGSPAGVGLSPGEAARIMTGAKVPGSAVAVVPVEQTDAAATGPAPERVTLTVDAIPGRHIRRQGEDVMAGSVVAPAGTLITPRLIALARSAGCFAAVVWTPMRVAVVATGTELIDPGHLLGAAGIHESNSDMVGALAESAGCIVTSVDICSDDPDGLTALLRDLDRRDDVDLVVTTGGVSQGAFEVVRQVGASLGGFDFSHLAMQPGGPQGLGRVGTTPVVCLPGTPVGAYVSFQMLVRPALDACHGLPLREPGSAAYRGKRRRVRMGSVQYITAMLAVDGTVAAADGRHLTALAEANVLIEVPEGFEELIDGDEVLVHPL